MSPNDLLSMAKNKLKINFKKETIDSTKYWQELGKPEFSYIYEV